MTTCGFSKRLLHSWYDGAAGSAAAQVEAHLQRCGACSAEVDAWRQASEKLRQVIDAGVGHVEPLVALRDIRERIHEAEKRSIVGRLRAFWDDLWLLHRRAVAGVAAAAALGALCAPAVTWWLGEAGVDVTTASGAQMASVVVESLEFGDDAARAVVYNADDGMTTLIWVEPIVSHRHESAGGGDDGANSQDQEL